MTDALSAAPSGGESDFTIREGYEEEMRDRGYEPSTLASAKKSGRSTGDPEPGPDAFDPAGEAPIRFGAMATNLLR
ncbi:hypothetical protein, partial [Microvirga massiliensis]|uniref:hypothetical protein n=1 Tax=Microvirga massiliensis TaxID=1033741 RepID=UPI001AEC445D